MTDLQEEKLRDEAHEKKSVDDSIEAVFEQEKNMVGKEMLSKEEIKKLRLTIENTEVDDGLKLQTQNHAQNMMALDSEDKVKKLLEIADQRGVVYAVSVAKKLDDPYVLDLLHDQLVLGGYYTHFQNKIKN